ncbi:hypothetical protein P8452_29848 [Trifolium repens]|nr:hypothetical protein P8452_29848 [Trifolium repens]
MFDSGYKSQYIGGQKEKFVRLDDLDSNLNTPSSSRGMKKLRFNLDSLPIPFRDPGLIAKRYLRRYFIFDFWSVLPLPQAVVWKYLYSSRQVKKTAGVFSENALLGAMYYLIWYMLASHITEVFPKFCYCLWWGLQNLSTLGQGLLTSTYPGEVMFSIVIAIMGLVLFSLLIGNMQTYLNSMSVRLEEMRIKRRDSEQWMHHRLLPPELRERVRRYDQYKWLNTRGVDEESLVQSLPKDLRRDIKRHLCLNLVRRVPLFANMDERLLDAISAWRKHLRRKRRKEEEEEYFESDYGGSDDPSTALVPRAESSSRFGFNTTIYASRFAANLRGHRRRVPSSSDLVNIPKPTEPDFSALDNEE